jgi:hypothetical protein
MKIGPGRLFLLQQSYPTLRNLLEKAKKPEWLLRKKGKYSAGPSFRTALAVETRAAWTAMSASFVYIARANAKGVP